MVRPFSRIIGFALGLTVATLLSIASVSAATASPTSAPACAPSVRAFLGATVRLVTLPDVPTFTAKGQGELCFSVQGKKALLVAESVPRLTYEAERPPANLAALTIYVDTMPGTTPYVSWDSWPVVTLSGVDVRVRAYDIAAAQITSTQKPIMDLLVTGLTFSTQKVTVEGEEAEGYVDGDNLDALLVGKTILPEDEYKPYHEWLAGREAIVEVYARMHNPYAKEKRGEASMGTKE